MNRNGVYSAYMIKLKKRIITREFDQLFTHLTYKYYLNYIYYYNYYNIILIYMYDITNRRAIIIVIRCNIIEHSTRTFACYFILIMQCTNIEMRIINIIVL